MGTIYYAVNDDKKHVALLGKWTEVCGTEGSDVLNLSDEVFHAYDGSDLQSWWQHLVTMLRAFGATRLLCDSCDDMYGGDDYVITVARYREDYKYLGKTMREYYE